jgi:segregation and condensation protein B
MVQQLLDRNLLRIEGCADLPGRPLLYCTTDLFLDHFGIRTLDDLPNAAELRRVKLPTPEDVAVANDNAGTEAGAVDEDETKVAKGKAAADDTPELALAE